MNVKTSMNHFFKKVFIVLLAISIIDFTPLVVAQDMSVDNYLNTDIKEVNPEYAHHQLTINLDADGQSFSKVIEFSEHSTLQINAINNYQITSIKNGDTDVSVPYNLGVEDTILDIVVQPITITPTPDVSEIPDTTPTPNVSETPVITNTPDSSKDVYKVLNINQAMGLGTLEEPYVIDKDIEYIFKIDTLGNSAFRVVNNDQIIEINSLNEFKVLNPSFSVLILQEKNNEQWKDIQSIHFVSKILPKSLEIMTRMSRALTPEIQLYVNVMPEDSTDKEVTWEIIKGQEYATISEKGLLTPIGNGDVTVKATSIINPLVFTEATFAVAAAKTYRITWNYNGGSGTPVYTDVLSGTFVQTVLPSAPTRSGYIFDGWYVDQNFVTPIDATTTVTNTVTYYAKWYTIPEAPLPPNNSGTGLKPGEVAASKTATWVDYDNNIGRIDFTLQGMPTKTGSDVIIVLDKSGSMASTRWTPANNAVSTLANDLFKNSNEYNNRVALVKFSDNISGSFNFKNSKASFDAANTATSAAGGTYYDLALKEVITYANSRSASEKSRPLYVIFISDGAPTATHEGDSQLSTLKGIANRIYAVGIQISSGDTSAINQLNKLVYNGTYTNVVNMSDLNGVLAAIRGRISIAATNAIIEDTISDYYEIINTAANPLPPNSTVSGQKVTVNVGDILETPTVYSIYVRLKDRNTSGSFPTNNGSLLTYKDVNGNSSSKDQSIMGSPSLPNSAGSINISYYRVNTSGQYITDDGTVLTESQKPFAKIGDTVLFKDNNGSTSLALGKTYTVSAILPVDYQLYSGDTGSRSVTINSASPIGNVEFKCVKNPTFTATWKNDDGTTLYVQTNLKANETPTYTQIPNKLPTNEFTYDFSGWVDQNNIEYPNNTFEPITTNMTYTAKYSEKKRQYPVNVVYIDEDTLEVLKPQYTQMLDYGSNFDALTLDTNIANYVRTNSPSPITISNGDNKVVLYYSLDKIGKDSGLNGGDGIPDKYQIKVTYNVTNGTFDGVSGPYVLTKYDNGVPSKTGIAYLNNTQIPTAKPFINYENPTWNIVPTTTLALTSDTSFFLTYSAIPTFTVRWLDGSGHVLHVDYNVLRDTIVTSDLTPTKDSDVQYDYTFDGWSPMIGAITSNTDYIAQFKPVLKSYDYTVKYLDKFDNMQVLSTDVIDSAKYGDVISAKSLKKDIIDYIYVDASNENTTIDGPNKIITLYYGKDVIGKDGGINGGDGILDAYQIIVSFDIHNGTWIDNADPRVFTLKDTNGNNALPTNGGTYTFDANTLPKSQPDALYEDKGWINVPNEPIILNVNTTFTQAYDSIPTYTVTWKNADGSILEVDTNVLRGNNPSYDSMTPIKKQTDSEYYVFNGWLDTDNNNISPVTKDVTYIAQFKTVIKTFTYTVQYVDANTNIALQNPDSFTVPYNTVVDGTQYKKSFTNYVFNSMDPSMITVIDNNATIIIKYDVDAIGKDGGLNGGDGIADKYQEVVDFNVINGTFTDYKGPQVVTKYIDNQLNVNGIGRLEPNQIPSGVANQYYENGIWNNDPNNTDITQNQIFTLTYSPIPRYTINWINDDGSTLEVDTNVLRGEIPSYDALLPSKAMDAAYTYVFTGWDQTILPVANDITYKACYDAIPRIYEYKVLYLDYKTGQTISDTLVNYAPYNTSIDYNTYLKPIDGYAFISATDNFIIDGDNKQLKLYYGIDIIGKDGGINGGDGIADMFQITVNYNISNGVFLGDTGPFVLTLKDDNQKISVDGYAYLTSQQIPTPVPNTGYEGYWYYVPNTYTKIYVDTTYIYSAGDLIEYNIKFVNYDGSTLQQGITQYGYTPSYNGLTPTRNFDDRYNYQFIGWDKAIVPATSDATYTAIYHQSDRMYDYSVRYVDEDTMMAISDDLLLESTYQNKIHANNYIKKITGYAYTSNSGDINVDNINHVITIYYSKDVIGYNETLSGSDGIPDKYQVTLLYGVNNGIFVGDYGPYVVTLRDNNGNLSKDGSFTITSKYIPQGQAYPNYENGVWSPSLTVGDIIKSNMNYVLNYTAIPTFTVNWINDDNANLEVDNNVLRDTMATYNSNTPYKAPDAQYTYVFDGWDQPVTFVTKDITYKATYRKLINSYDYTLNYKDIENNQYLVASKVLNTAYGTLISYQNYLQMIDNYVFVSAENDMTITGSNQSLTLFYAKDVIGKNGGINGGDGIPDMYQVIVYFECIGGTFNNYNGPYVLTLHDDNGRLAKASDGGKVTITNNIIPSATPNEGNENGQWNKDPLNDVINTDSSYVFSYQAIPTYEVKWKNGDNILEVDRDVMRGTIPLYDGVTPSKDADYQYNYVFEKFTDVSGNDVMPVKHDIDYYAQYTRIDKYYDFIVKYVDEDTNNIIDGPYSYNVIHDSIIDASNYIKLIPNYVYTNNSGDIVFDKDNVNNEIIIYYSVDKIGKNGGVNGSDGIADKYQATISYDIVNAQFTTSSDPKVVTLLKDGNYAIKGEGTFTLTSDYIPSSMANYGYENGSWDNGLINGKVIDNDIKFTMTYNLIPSYTIRFVNDDDTDLIDPIILMRDSMPYYSSTTPIKASDAKYSYSFIGWDSQITAVQDNKIYKAVYQPVIRNYNYYVQYLDYFDNNNLYPYLTDDDKTNVDNGFMAPYDSLINTNKHQILIDGYTYISADNNIVVKDTKTTANLYYAKDVIGKDGGVNGGDGIPDAYQVIVQFACNNGTMSNYNGPYVLNLYDHFGNLAQASDGGVATVATNLIPIFVPDYGFENGQWVTADPRYNHQITTNTTFIYSFGEIAKYDVKWVNYDGQILKELYQVFEGDTVHFVGNNPVRPTQNGIEYIFTGWSPSEGVITANTVYTAQYFEKPIDYMFAVEHYLIDKNGHQSLVVSENHSAKYNDVVDGKDYIKPFDGYVFMYSSGKHTILDNNQRPQVFYGVDNIGKDGTVNGGDGIADIYQITVGFVVENGVFTNYSGPYVLTLKNDVGEITLAKDGGYAYLANNQIPTGLANSGYIDGTWNVMPSTSNKLTSDTNYVLTYHKVNTNDDNNNQTPSIISKTQDSSNILMFIGALLISLVSLMLIFLKKYNQTK